MPEKLRNKSKSLLQIPKDSEAPRSFVNGSFIRWYPYQALPSYALLHVQPQPLCQNIYRFPRIKQTLQMFKKVQKIKTDMSTEGKKK